jgi:hypothetical protein
MSNHRSRLAGALLGALLAFGIGGASFAFAQTATESPPTTDTPAAGDSTTAPGPEHHGLRDRGRDGDGDGEGHCHDGDGGGGGGGGTAPSTGTGTAPSGGTSPNV